MKSALDSSATPRILIVEDEVISSLFIEGLIESFGYIVAGTAARGEDAVALARDCSPDLILMDIILDGEMSGIDAAREIQQFRDIPVVYLTANADQVTVLKARTTNPFGYIVKPVNEKELFSNIDTALQKQKLLKQLRDSEKRYRTLIENSYDGILVIRDGVVLYANPRACSITGYVCENIVGKPISSFLHGDDRERVVNNYLKRFEGGSVDDAYSFRIHTASGELRWLELHAVPVRWEGAESLLVFLNDITESREAGDTIRRYANDLGRRVRELQCMGQVSRYLSEHTGPLDDLMPRILKSMQEAMQYPDIACAAITLKDARYETDNFRETPWSTAGDITPGGVREGTIELLYLEEQHSGNAGPFLPEEVELLHEIALQLSGFLQRRKLEEERELLSLVVESTDDAIIVESLEGIIWSWNRGAEMMYGYSAEEMTGASVYRIVPEACRDEVLEILDRIKRGQRIEHYETVRLHREGRTLNVSLSFSPVVDRRGVTIGASAITRDITEKRKLERGLVEAGLRERREIGHILHDNLGQVLTGAAFMTEALRKMLRETHPEGSAQAAEVQQIINQAIELTRSVSRGLVPVDLTESSLEDSLQKLAETSREMYGISCGTVFERDFSIDDPILASELYYIAQEALRNAVTHGNAKRVDIILRQNRERLALVVQDDGKGLQNAEGNAGGIGMKIMEYRARLLGGRLSVISRREGGVIVICTVPSEHNNVSRVNEKQVNTLIDVMAYMAVY